MSASDDLPDREGAAEQLKALIERLEDLNDQAADIASEKSEVRARAKGEGFDVPTITAIVKRRKVERDKGAQAVLEADLLLETYEQALGCGAAAAGMLSATRGADGVFEVKMVTGSAPGVAEKLTRATKARRDSIALAELARQAREQ